MEITAMALTSACPQFKLQSVTLFTSRITGIVVFAELVIKMSILMTAGVPSNRRNLLEHGKIIATDRSKPGLQAHQAKTGARWRTTGTDLLYFQRGDLGKTRGWGGEIGIDVPGKYV